MNTWIILLAAGKGSRMAEAGITSPKQFLHFKGVPLFWHSALTFASIPTVKGIQFVFPEDQLDEAYRLVSELTRQSCFAIPWNTVSGGVLRQDSVRNGLEALPPSCDTVLVHDAARPFVSAGLAARIISCLEEGKPAVIPTLPVKDTVKVVRYGMVESTLSRERLAAVQTPQGFSRTLLSRAHAAARQNEWAVTDDASMVELTGEPVFCIPGEEHNVKITTPHDLQTMHAEQSSGIPCTGWGYDVHRFGPEGRPLVLGGVPIPNGPSVLAHSDGDVLLHALCDALLGCIGRGDIGLLFPDTDPEFENASSSILLSEVLHLAQRDAFCITHVDMTLICQVPKIAPYRAQILKNIAALLQIPESRVNLKATTEEGLGFTGEKKGIKAVATVTGLKEAPAENS